MISHFSQLLSLLFVELAFSRRCFLQSCTAAQQRV